MSLSTTPLDLYQVPAPITDVRDKYYYPVIKAGQRVTWKPVVSTSYSNSSAQFSAPPPSPGIFVDRRVYVRYPVSISFTGTAPVGQNLLQSGADAFRAYPITSIVNTLTVSINGEAAAINMSDIAHPLLRFNTGRELFQGANSTTPTMTDTYQRYEAGKGTVLNPLAQRGDNSYQTPRGGFPMDIASNTNTAAQVDAVLTEPLFLSPLAWGRKDTSGFIGVQTMEFNFTFVGDLSRIWSHDDSYNSTINSVTVTLGQPSLLFRYVTPQNLESIPPSIPYSYYKAQRYPTDANAAVAPGALVTLSSQNTQLTYIPTRVYIFARQRNSDRDFRGTDTYFSLENISVNWNNNSGLLSSASKEDLYQISSKNGFDGSWSDWSGGPVNRMIGGTNAQYGTVGSILCLEFGTDIGLDDLEAPGQMGTYQLQLTATFRNVNQTQAITPTLYVIAISEGAFTIEGNTANAKLGIISKQDVLDARDAPVLPYSEVEAQYGGSFLSGLKDFAHEALPFIKEGINIAEKVAPIAAPLLLAAGNGGAIVGGRMKYAQTAKDREDEARAMEAYWRAKKSGGAKYAQTKKDREDEARGMEAYWRAMKGGRKKYGQTKKDREDEARAMEAYWRAMKGTKKKGGRVMTRSELARRLS